MGARVAADRILQFTQRKVPSPWMSWYLYTVILLGGGVSTLALVELPLDHGGLLFFGLMAGVAQLADVELFASSRTRISVSNVLAIASILLFGPLAGALTHLVSGLMTTLTTSLRSQTPVDGRASLLKRAAFNVSMLLLSTTLAGWAYVWLGGTVGEIARLSNALPLVVAVGLDTLANMLILLWMIALQTGRRPFEIWRRDFSWGAPVNILAGILGGGALALAYAMQGILGVLVFLLPILAISYAFRLYVHNTRSYVDELEATRKTQAELIDDLLETLSAMVDAKDRFTYQHSAKVVDYALAIAQQMGLSTADQELLRRAALVHDIGKIGIWDPIIGKQGKLTPEEFKLIKSHPVIGAEIIGRMRGLQSLVPLVRHHHERWDGGGYPDGLSGATIPLLVRILSLADTLEAMLADRPYRPTMSFTQVKAEILRCSGTQFDPQVVQAFLALAERKDATFFVNSAALVERAAFLSGLNAEATGGRYLKKSMLE